MDGAGYHVFDHLPVARRVVQVYQQHLPYHSRGLAVQEVIARLVEGEPEQALATAAVTYARWVKACKKELRYTCSATTFFSLGGEWERFRDGVVPEVPEERDQRHPKEIAQERRAAAEERERAANMQQVKQGQEVLSGPEMRRKLDQMRRAIGGMP